MIEFVFATDDAARVRFAFSPLWELVHSLRVLNEPARHALHLPWVRSVRPRTRGFETLRSLVPSAGYIPDFLTPPPATPLPDFAAELATVRATPPDVVAHELGRAAESNPALWPLVAEPERVLAEICELLEGFWEAALLPYWDRIHDLLEGDVLRRTRALAAVGAEGVFADLHGAVRWRAGTLTVERPWDFWAELQGRGLLLVPSVFVWPDVSVMVPPYQPMLSYPPYGVATLWETRPAAPPDALAALIGRGRAHILTALATPASTTELARRLGVTPGAISQHLGVLRGCGLVTGQRLGRRVLYQRTRAGDMLAGSAQ
ncbi:DUF5937 family protein [Actinomadura hibisca]|uniref:DUF5937 family protein n=1 Tax=Actinomadura hibisca TaxID=68565 RepID=UPI00082C5472|nr:DUF5937 family protein [Actinomadura hibisca]